jgi:ketosteroid isomerase-like protein
VSSVVNELRKELAARARLCDIHTMHIRNRWTLTLCLLATSSAGLWAQEKSDSATVRALELKWTESYKQHNIDILSSLLSDEFVITIEDGSIYSKAGYITHSADSAVHVQVAELSDLKVRLHGDTAIVTGAYHEKGESKGKPYEYHDRLTDVWMKIGGRWQVMASHYSVPSK